METPAVDIARRVSPTADRALLAALSALAEALRELPSPSMIIGGIAVIARGVPRQTIDIDATIWGAPIEIGRLVKRLEEHEIIGRISDAEDFARSRQVLLLRHAPTGVPMEVSLAWLPFEKEALDRATEVDFSGVRIAVAQPEDLVVYKAVAWRDRDKSDIERLLTLHSAGIDIDRVRGLVRDFARALDEPEREEEFESLLRRTGINE